MVNDKTANQGKQTTDTEEDSYSGNQSAEKSPIERANEAAKRMELANEERRKLLEREEELESRRILGGNTSGKPKIEKKEEIDPKTYAKLALAGKLPSN